MWVPPGPKAELEGLVQGHAALFSRGAMVHSPPRAWRLGLTIPRPLFCTELKLPSLLPCCFVWREAGDHTGMPLPPWFEAERSRERSLVMINRFPSLDGLMFC